MQDIIDIILEQMNAARNNISTTLPINMEEVIAPFIGLSPQYLAIDINLTLGVIYPYELWHVEVFGSDVSAA